MQEEFKEFNVWIDDKIRLSCLRGGLLKIFGTPNRYGKVPDTGLKIGRLCSHNGKVTQYNKVVLPENVMHYKNGVPSIGFNAYVIQHLPKWSLVLVKLYRASASFEQYAMNAGEILETEPDYMHWKGTGHELQIMIKVEDLKPLVLRWHV